jgi:Arc/MetJ family transcription regulator
MNIHIDIDETLLASVQRLGGYTTKREAVHAALGDHARRMAALKLLALRGTRRWQGDLDDVRKARFPEWDAPA